MDRVVSVERVIDASAPELFRFVADPSNHPVFDGSETVRGVVKAEPLREIGQHFEMNMKIGVAYKARSTVSEFEQDRRIAWRPFLYVFGAKVLGGQIWRYEFEPQASGTLVRETYDWGAAITPWLLRLAKFPERTEPAMRHSLDNLARAIGGQDR